MNEPCGGIFPRIDAFLDGELAEEGTRQLIRHLAGCAACSAELESRRALKRALFQLRLPEAPAPAREGADGPVPERPRRARWIAAAASVLAALAVLFLLPGRIPEVVALSSELHDRYLDGKLAPGELGLKVAIPGADFVGRCDCPPALGRSIPFIVYRRGQTPISLLILESAVEIRRDLSRADGAGFDLPFWSFRVGPNTVLVCPKGGLTQIWVARLDEAEILQAVRATRVGQAFAGRERVTLDELS
jgi:hypothetical protein